MQTTTGKTLEDLVEQTLGSSVPPQMAGAISLTALPPQKTGRLCGQSLSGLRGKSACFYGRGLWFPARNIGRHGAGTFRLARAGYDAWKNPVGDIAVRPSAEVNKNW